MTGPSAAIVAELRSAGCVFAEDEARLLESAALSPSELVGLVARRCEGEPLEQVLGWADFCGVRIAVSPGVFVPRRRSERLVAEALRLLPPGGVIVDLACGSGAVAAVLLAAVDGIEAHAADVDPAAVRCARRNVATRGGQVHEGDLYAALPGGLHGRVDVLVANVPYVPTDAIALMPPEARTHEPRVALDGGPDGLDVVRRLVSGAGPWLAPSGHLLVETSRAQSAEVVEMCSGSGLVGRVVTDDDLDATVVVAGPVSTTT